MTARTRESTPPPEDVAAQREVSPMTAEELKRVHLKKVEEEQMKSRYSASTHDEPARQSLGGGTSSRLASADSSTVQHSMAASSATNVTSLTPSRSSRPSLLDDLDKIRQERAIEEDRLRSSRSSLGGGLSTPLRGVAEGMPPQHSGTRGSNMGGGTVGGGMLGPSFSPLQQYPAHTQVAPSSVSAHTQRAQQQTRQPGGLTVDDLPPPPPTSARKSQGAPPTSHGQQSPAIALSHTQHSPAIGRNIFAAENSAYSAVSSGGGFGGGGGRAHGGGPETFAAILNVPGGGGAIPRELVPVVQAAVEHSMASVPLFLSSFSFGSGLGRVLV